MKFIILSLFLLLGCQKTKKLNELNVKVESQKEKEFVFKNTPHISDERKKVFCDLTKSKFKKYKWKNLVCEDTNWHGDLNSVNGTPLVWQEFSHKKNDTENRTLILCGVHGDEITPVSFCFNLLNYLREKNESEKPYHVVVAPIVNPDSFYKKYPSRTNANGVDINRNFPTKDFDRHALKLWRGKYHKDKRRYPGTKSMSEPEVQFQVNLIKNLRPTKIISVHSPLHMIDYDGPHDRTTGGVIGSEANALLIRMSEQAKNYRIKNYPFFPGSLGNYAGNERGIPTYTLELPTIDYTKSQRYWKKFKNSVVTAIFRDIQSFASSTQ